MRKPHGVKIVNLRTHPKRFVTVRDLAEYCDKDESTLRRHIRKGALYARRIGGSVRIPIEAAREYCGEEER